MRNRTSWQSVHSWYDKHQKEGGGYYHREVILPKLLGALKLDENSRVLDLGCGEGILGRKLKEVPTYLGIDASAGLIKNAKLKDPNKEHRYQLGDVTRELKAPNHFTHAFFILSLQNIAHPKKALENVWNHLEEDGSLTLVLNHPCFRVPKHSSWGVDTQEKKQFRRLERYLSPFRTTIQAHPSQRDRSPATLSFHRPLSLFFTFLKEAGFCVEDFQELCSNKKSYGKMAKAENYARDEFPLFAVLHCRKVSKRN